MSENPKSQSLYDLLEVSPRARSEVIEAAYNTLSKLYDSDKSSESQKAAESINHAKKILLDEKKRKEYDKDRENLEGKIVGNYRILEKIAEGGFGKTYKGENIILNEPVCIKHSTFISPQYEHILLEEAKAIWDLRHFGIPTMRDLLRLEDGSHALVMSYIPGPTLEKIIKQVKKLEPEHVAWMTERVINVLKYLHFHGVIHGDVKPSNIIIQPDDHTVVLVDYGLAMITPKKEDKSKGYTPNYASPEQLRGRVLLPESDFYSLGLTMLKALGGDIKTKKFPSNTPSPLEDFLKRFLVYDVISRPNWEKEDLAYTIGEARKKSFGRRSTGLKPIPGLK